MSTMTLQAPDELENEHEETARFIAAKLHEAGKITLGKLRRWQACKNGILPKS